MPLNEEQQQAFDLVESGRNIFLTGPGGTGKSYLIQEIVKRLTADGKRVAVTALTGCAALLLGHGAKTIHSWAGIGLGKDTTAVTVANMRRYNQRAMRRWMLTNLLIIDEVSMMTPDLLEKLSEVASAIRKDSRPFGGLQIMFVGDFFQLPPVVKRDEIYAENQVPKRQFAFQSSVWNDLALCVVNLQTIVRQCDPVFQQVLNEARIGKLSSASLQILMNRQTDDWQKQKIRPTLLFARRAEVDMINEQNMRALKTPIRTFEAKTLFDATLESGLTRTSPQVERAVAKLDRDAPYKASLELRVGAQVMLVYNMDQECGLVNGSRGVVEGFTDTVPPLPLVLFKGRSVAIPVPEVSWQSEEIEGLKRSQIPLILAYAVTIHKCQGATLDSALIDIGPATFEVGQAYVALSRVKSLEGLYIYELDPSAFKAHVQVKKFYESMLLQDGF